MPRSDLRGLLVLGAGDLHQEQQIGSLLVDSPVQALLLKGADPGHREAQPLEAGGAEVLLRQEGEDLRRQGLGIVAPLVSTPRLQLLPSKRLGYSITEAVDTDCPMNDAIEVKECCSSCE